MSKDSILLGGIQDSEDNVTGKSYLLGSLANRHGLIAGATGTGKTVSLQVLAQGFSKLGVPVFAADIKGDLAGVTQAGSEHPKVSERVEKIGIENFSFEGCPSIFWDVYQKNGTPIRTTISEMGPTLLSRLMDLNETQEGVLQIAFSLADDEGMLLLDLKDLRSMLQWIADNHKDIGKEYGSASPRSVAAIQRRLLMIEESGGDIFFGEPALKLEHLMQKDFSGRGVISILDATTLINNPRIYSTFLLWLMRELFTDLPEIGDQALPKMVFFFDEAHLLFDSAPKSLLDEIIKVVKLIRSRGVGLYFITQNPQDIPDPVLAQLGNRIQHALRAYTPKEQKAIKAAAQSFRVNPGFKTEELITQLGVGEALVSTLNEDGEPTVVEKVLMSPPNSRIGTISDEERKSIISSSPVRVTYETAIDRESAFELLKVRREELEKKKAEEAEQEKKEKEAKSKSRRQGPGEAFFKSMVRTIGTTVGRTIIRGVLGSITKGR